MVQNLRDWTFGRFSGAIKDNADDNNNNTINNNYDNARTNLYTKYHV